MVTMAFKSQDNKSQPW